MNKYFITATDTDVGKTIISSILMLSLNAHYWKPIQSGSSDVEQVKDWTGLESDARFFPASYSFKAALSPDQAARLENITINLDQCKLPSCSGTLVVEGAGGIFAPLNESQCIIHLVQNFKIPVIIVARGTLGTINHTLLTIEALRHRHISIKGVIFSGELNPDNQYAVETKGKVKTLFHVPLLPNLSADVIRTWTSQNKATILENFSNDSFTT